MSLLLLYRPSEGEGPPPPDNTPVRTLLGVGLTLALVFVLPLGALTV